MPVEVNLSAAGTNAIFLQYSTDSASVSYVRPIGLDNCTIDYVRSELFIPVRLNITAELRGDELSFRDVLSDSDTLVSDCTFSVTKVN